jgi:selenocysteine lyase/cysteine desulfurase
MLGCDAEELAFTRNATEGINIVANGVPLAGGDEIILSTEEHVGNAVTWVALARRVGVRLRRFVPSVASAGANLERIADLIGPRTRLIAVPHVTTTTGLVLPVREIAALARPKGITVFVDGAQGPGAIPVDLHALGCDAYATSGHKWLLGPKETGLLYVRRDMLDAVGPRHVGAYSAAEFDFAGEALAWHPGAQRYEYGTVSVPLRRGLGAALTFLDTVGLDTILERDARLAGTAAAGLRRIDGVRILSPERREWCAPMVTFALAGVDTQALLVHLERARIRARGVWEGGLSGVRVSFHVHNSEAEVEALLEAVAGAGK